MTPVFHILCSPFRALTIVNEILQSKGLSWLSTFPLKAPLWRKPKLPHQWWMDIINVVHLFTFYSAIWENEGSTAKGKCAYFGTPVPESHPFCSCNIKRHCRLQALLHSTSWPSLNHGASSQNPITEEVDLYIWFLDQLKHSPYFFIVIKKSLILALIRLI